jgi:pre-60S factor REI1
VPSRSAAAVQVDDQSLRLESGKVLTHRSQAKVRPRKHRRTPEAASIPDAIPSRDPAQSSQALDVEQPPAPESKRVAKLAARFDHHLMSMRAQDRRSIMHLPLYEQRALVAKSKRQVEHARKAENEMLLKIQLRANKTIKK